jgi:hypothetical protein
MHTSDKEDFADLQAVIHSEKQARFALNDRWKDLWSLYRTDPLQVQTDDGWQSKLNDGRVFEVVETVASYIRSALFFSDNWLELEPTKPSMGEVAPLVSAHFRNLLASSNLKEEFRVFIRQLLLLGFSAMSVDWLDDKLVFSTENSYGLYIESSRRFDEHSYSFRDNYLNKAAWFSLVDSGALGDDLDAEEVWEKYKVNYSSELNQYRDSQEVSTTFADSLLLVEYWCPVEKELYYILEDECLYSTPMDCPPWLVAQIYQVPSDAYGLNLLTSSLGLILESNMIMNRRLDNMAVSVDNMWLFVDDGITNPDDIKTAPGKVIPVGSPDALTPLYPPPNNFQVTYQESSIIDSRIERNTGTGALISSGQYRSGERVTAEEINAVKDAGGNRLTDLYEHIESAFVLPLLKRALRLVAENRPSGVVKLASATPGVYDYYKVLASDFKNEYNIKLSASQSIINRDRNIRRLQEFIAMVNTVPQFQELVDYKNLYTDMLYKFGFDNPQRYILQPKEEEPAPAAPTSPMQAMVQGAGAVGGATMANAVTEMAAGDEMPQLLSNLTQMPTAGGQETLDPALAQQQMLAMQQPIGGM